MIRLLWLQMRTCLVFFLDSSISLVHHTHFNKRMRILIAKLGLWRGQQVFRLQSLAQGTTRSISQSLYEYINPWPIRTMRIIVYPVSFSPTCHVVGEVQLRLGDAQSDALHADFYATLTRREIMREDVEKGKMRRRCFHAGTFRSTLPSRDLLRDYLCEVRLGKGTSTCRRLDVEDPL